MPKVNVSRSKRERIYRRDGYACWYCGVGLVPATTSAFGSFVLSTDQQTIPALDHLDPQIRGGYDLDANLVTACRRCNSRKGKKTLEEYRCYLAGLHESKSGDAEAWIKGSVGEVIFWGERGRREAA